MSEETKKINSEENNKSGNKLILIIISLVVALLLGFLAYSYYIGSKNNPEGNFIEKIKSGKDKVLEKVSILGNEEFNYSFSFDAKFKEKDKKGELLDSGSLTITDGQVYSSKDAFKQRLSIGKIKMADSSEEKVILENLDVVSDMFKVYYKYKSSELLKPLLVTQGDGNYRMIDNEKIILDTIGNLAKNEVIKEFALSIATSNPQQYLLDNKTYEKLKKEVKNDKFINYFFVKSGEAIKNDGKTKQNLVFADNICEDTLPVLSKLFEAFTSKNGMLSSQNPFENKEVCKDSIKQVNGTMGFVVQVYKEGNLEKGDYDFVIAMGNSFSFTVNYKSHDMTKWEMIGKAPNQDTFRFLMNGDINGVKSTEVKVDYEDGEAMIKGEIINGKGELSLESKSGNGFSGKVVFDNYYLENIDLSLIKDNEKFGTIKGFLKEKTGELNINSNLDDEKVTGLLKYKEKYFELKINSEELKIDILFDGENIKVLTDFNGKGIEANGKFKSLSEFNLNAKSLREDGSLLVEGKRQGKEVNYKFDYNEDSNNASGNAVLKRGNENGFETINLKGKVKNVTDNSYDFDFSFNYKKGGAKFEVPTKFEEFGETILEMNTLPALNPTIIKKQYKYFGEKILPFYIVGAGAFGFYTFIDSNDIFIKKIFK